MLHPFAWLGTMTFSYHMLRHFSNLLLLVGNCFPNASNVLNLDDVRYFI